MNNAELFRRIRPLIKAQDILQALNDCLSIRSTLVDRIDISKTYSIRLKHMEEGNSHHPETTNAVRTLLASLQSATDEHIRLSVFNSGRKYYLLFTDKDINRLIGLLESSIP